MVEVGGWLECLIIIYGMNLVLLMLGVEVVLGDKILMEIVDFICQILFDMKKVFFLVFNILGFWVNWFFVFQMLDVVCLLEQGKIQVEDGDIGLNISLGYFQGIFKLYDFVIVFIMLWVVF